MPMPMPSLVRCKHCWGDLVWLNGRWEHKPLPPGWINMWHHAAIAA